VDVNLFDEFERWLNYVPHSLRLSGRERRVSSSVSLEKLVNEAMVRTYCSVIEVVTDRRADSTGQVEHRPPSERVILVHNEPSKRKQPAVRGLRENLGHFSRVHDRNSVELQTFRKRTRPCLVVVRPKHDGNIFGSDSLGLRQPLHETSYSIGLLIPVIEAKVSSLSG
jgi:hypothetical protein